MSRQNDRRRALIEAGLANFGGQETVELQPARKGRRRRGNARTVSGVVSGVCKVLGWTLNLGLVCLLALAVLVFGGRFIGFGCADVISGSMEPEIPIGALAYYRAVDDGSELAVGEIAVFESGDHLVMHRVVEVDPRQGTLTTKGDANQMANVAPVAYGQVVGEYVGCIPRLGAAVDEFHTWVTSLVGY